MYGNPLLPGSKAYEKHHAKLERERDRVKSQGVRIDDKAVPINIRYAINFDQIRLKEQAQIKRELENRYLMNRISYIMQNKADTEHILKRPMFTGSSYKQNAVKSLEKRAKENTRVVLDFDRCYSDYDYIQQAFEWQDNRQKKYNISRYKEDLWKPVFEKQKRIQQLKGRALDPHYSFKFK